MIHRRLIRFCPILNSSSRIGLTRLFSSIYTEETSTPQTSKSNCITRLGLERLVQRGLIQASFPSTILDEKTRILTTTVDAFKPVIYAGFDPTADSLHIGNLLIINCLLHLSAVGYKVIFVIGSGTACLGDPAGRTTDREANHQDVILSNAASIRAQITQIVANFEDAFVTGKTLDCFILDNNQWYSDMNLIEFMSTVGRQFRIGAMLKRQMVRDRMDGNGLPLNEFVYQALQSYDWLHLNTKFGCAMQLGGSDQMGHLDAGYHLLKSTKHVQSCGFTTPLLVDANSRKLGKTAEGDAIWLSAHRTRPFQFYQYFRQLHDDTAALFLPYFTFMPLQEMRAILADHERNLGKWVAQDRLASDVTALVHGNKTVPAVKLVSNLIYSKRRDEESIKRLSFDECQSLADCLPSVSQSLHDQYPTITQIVRSFDAFQNDADAAQKISRGAVALNEIRVTDPEEKVTPSEWAHHRITTVRWGRRNFGVIRWTE